MWNDKWNIAYGNTNSVNGSECLTVTKDEKGRIEAAEMNFLRAVAG